MGKIWWTSTFIYISQDNEHNLYWFPTSLFDTRTVYEDFTMIKLVLEWMLKIYVTILVIIGSWMY